MTTSKGILFYDTLFSLIPLLLLINYGLFYINYSQSKSSQLLHQQNVFDKLVSAADYLVKIGLTKKSDGEIYPNLITGTDFNYEELASKIGLNHVYAGFIQKEKLNCIYRLVIYEDEIKKLYICGD